MTPHYDHRAVEARWRRRWEDDGTYRTPAPSSRPKQYVLDFFPYPSGEGLSVGHARNYVPTDVLARYFRMRGFAVLHPMGWDAFGLPAENEALLRGRHPRITTAEYAATYRRQLQLLGCSYDWSREFTTSDPAFYRWTQWGFLLLFRRGLVYRAAGWQWWCPRCRTILANEQVERGRCWRHPDTPVERRALQQWYVRTTAYADRLAADLAQVDWPERIKTMQRKWIGRSEGADLRFPVDGREVFVSVFTTRPETIGGAAFLALAPEHPLASTIAPADHAPAVAAYVEAALRRSEVDRMASSGEPSGVFTGAWAIHPLTRMRLPIYVADYVLGEYGTGAIMGVPACDERDARFATRSNLTTVPLSLDAASRDDVMRELQTHGGAAPAVRYRMRDWLISRQRYWGAPIPLVHCARCGTVLVPDEHLPVRLPDAERYEPSGTGRSPLAGIESFVRTTCPACGGPAERETDTLDGFADSNWYFLRFAAPHVAEAPWDPDAVRSWLPVDWYIGGAEHAVMHLLYARFFTKVLHDAGYVPFSEPFLRLRNQGSMLSPRDGTRMSKSRGNVVTPDDVSATVGADALRVAVMFLGPFEQDVTWDHAVMTGAARFVRRVHALVQRHISARGDGRGAGGSAAMTARVAEVVHFVGDAVEQFRFNVLVAHLMSFLNELERWEQEWRGTRAWEEVLRTTVRLVAPIVPFLAEEAWAMLGATGSVHQAPWPAAPVPTVERREPVTIVVQVDGRVRGRLVAAQGIAPDELTARARAVPRVQAALGGREITGIVVVPDRVVNFVTRRDDRGASSR